MHIQWLAVYGYAVVEWIRCVHILAVYVIHHVIYKK